MGSDYAEVLFSVLSSAPPVALSIYRPFFSKESRTQVNAATEAGSPIVLAALATTCSISLRGMPSLSASRSRMDDSLSLGSDGDSKLHQPQSAAVERPSVFCASVQQLPRLAECWKASDKVFVGLGNLRMH